MSGHTHTHAHRTTTITLAAHARQGLNIYTMQLKDMITKNEENLYSNFIMSGINK